MTQDTGGPAFPLPLLQEGQDRRHGMTLLDYFAAQALPFALEWVYGQSVEDYRGSRYNSRSEWAADLAYDAAVAMLKCKRDLSC